MTEPLNANNFKYDMASIGKWCEYAKIDNASQQKINSVFKECDTEDAKGNKVDGGDGVLNKNEQAKFQTFLQEKLPALYDKFVEFFIMMDLIQDKEEADKAAAKDSSNGN